MVWTDFFQALVILTSLLIIIVKVGSYNHTLVFRSSILIATFQDLDDRSFTNRGPFSREVWRKFGISTVMGAGRFLSECSIGIMHATK